jgi:predicted Fe-Mo cluster-binding NifX family protein
MRIAISIFKGKISPRFDVAPELRLYDIKEQKITNEKEISCEGWNDMKRVHRLKELGVEMVVCGGISNYLCETLLNNNINVFPWVTGDVKDVLKKFLKGETKLKKIAKGKKRHSVMKKSDEID